MKLFTEMMGEPIALFSRASGLEKSISRANWPAIFLTQPGGRLRMVDEATGRSIEVRDLRIAPPVLHVALELPDCGLAGRKLTWEPSEHATKGNVVLRYDTSSTVCDKVGGASTNEFAIFPELAKKVGDGHLCRCV